MKKYRLINDSFMRSNLLNYFFRGLSFLFSFLNVRLSIDFLGDELYGIWLTVITILNWMNLSDFGLGNGLRNQLTESIALKDYKKSKSLIYTACIVLSRITFIIAVISFIIICVLRKINVLPSNLFIPLIISVLGFCINFVLGISRSIGYSLQKSFMVVATQAVADGILFCALLVVKNTCSPSLITYSVISSVNLIIANLGLLCILFFKFRYIFGFRKQLYSPHNIYAIAKLGIQFLILQITSMLLFTVDNLIIQYFMGGSAVTYYNVINKIYTGCNDLFSILLISTWSAVTFAKTVNDMEKIYSIKKKLLILWGLFSMGILVISPILNPFIKIWIGPDANVYSGRTITIFALYSILLAWNGIWVNIDNGLGQLKVQIIGSVAGAVLNVPLSLFFMLCCGLGIDGVRIGTFISLLFTSIPLPIHVYRKTRRKNMQKKIC